MAPLLFTNARIVSGDPRIGTVVGDVLVGGDLLVGVGPGIINAAEDDGATVVDCTGAAVVPLHGTLFPGERADFVVVPDGGAVELVVAGRRVSVPAEAPAAPAGVPPAQDLAGHRRLGTWVDTADFLHQHLTADGRYDETRGGREHAFQGRYWIDGDRVDYLDDLGFWAFGEFVGDELHHAGYVMRRGAR